MDRWISREELNKRLVAEKLLIAGLSNAGKTAVKRIFFLKQQTAEVEQLQATIDYERLVMDIDMHKVVVVDLGGQRVFIKRFLNEFSPFIFSNVTALIFVIDMAARTTRNDSIKYFSSCIEKLQRYSPDAEYFIFLHKNDLVINSPNYESIHNQIKDQIQREANKTVRFFRTTIFKSNTVIDAFGRIIELTIPDIAQSEYVDDKKIGKIEEFAEISYITDSHEERERVDAIDTGLVTMESHSNTSEEDLVMSSSASFKPAFQDTETIKNLISTAVKTPDPNQESKEVKISEEQSVEDHDSKMEYLLKSSLKSSSEMERKTTVYGRPIIKATETLSSKTDFTKTKNDSINKDIERATADIKENTAGSKQKIEHQEEITHLMTFYGIKFEQANRLIKQGYSSIFQSAARIGVPVDFLMRVFFEYIPDCRYEVIDFQIDEPRLMEVFFAKINDEIQDSEMVKLLSYAVKHPKKSVQHLIQEFIEPIRKKQTEKEIVEDLLASECDDIILDDSMVCLSKTHRIYIKTQKHEYNCQITFYQGKKKLESPLVSKNVSKRDLLYLLTFESGIQVKNIRDFALQVVDEVKRQIDAVFEEN